jgi:hypothetical protein
MKEMPMPIRTLRLSALAACLPLVALAADAHPDLTGVWMVPMEVHESGVPVQAESTPWQPASRGDPRHMHIPTMAEALKATDARFDGPTPKPGAFDIGPRVPPALTAAGLAAFRRFDPKLDQQHDLNCYPFNVFLRLAGGLGPMLIVQNPRVVMIGTEINGDNFPRVIWMQPDSAHRAADALPSWEGFSSGRWIGDTLHVETVKIEGGYFGRGWPVSEQAQLIEDYRVVQREGRRELEILQTLKDPTNYTEPLMRVSYAYSRPDLTIHDFSCEEGKADQVEVHHPGS